MKYLTRLLGMAMLLAGLQFNVHGQDPNFSQYYSAPHLVNPAFAALFQGDFQVMMNYRNQWESATENPYRTVALGADAKFMPFKGCDYFGLGVNLIADQAGALSYSTTQANMSLSYFLNLDGYGKTFLASGFTFGVGQRSLKYDPDAFADGPESFALENILYSDLGAGLILVSRKDEHNYFYGGAAIHHINQPEMSVNVDNPNWLYGQEVPLERKYVAHAGAGFQLNDHFMVKPSFMLALQGRQYQINAGSFIQYRAGHVVSKHRNAFYLGTFYRWNDAISVATRVDIKDYFVTMSYDINISSLRTATRGMGGVEVSIAKALFRNFSTSCVDPTKCPKF